MTVAASIVLCGHDAATAYSIEKVRFGGTIDDAFHHGIPATLLVLLLKVNKEGPAVKEIWRKPGHQGQARELQKIMQSGRLVNISNFSVYTACSVIKKFLSKLNGGVFGRANEERLFAMVEQDDAEKQRDAFCRIATSMPVPVQHLLVLLFGTFRSIADSVKDTHMSAEAIGISVAPSLFHTCIHDGQRTAKIEDVVRFRIANEIVATIIRNFGYSSLFPRENYEFYARITGRTLRLDENWQFSFQYPAITFSTSSDRVPPIAGVHAMLEARVDCDDGLLLTKAPHVVVTHTRASESPPPRYVRASIPGGSMPRRYMQHSGATSTGATPSPRTLDDHMSASTSGEHLLLDESPSPYACRSAVSMSDVKTTAGHHYTESDIVRLSLLTESTRSLTYLEWVHERQMRRMVSRSEWFLSPSPNLMTNRSVHDIAPDYSTDDEASTSQSRTVVVYRQDTSTVSAPVAYLPRASTVVEVDEPVDSTGSSPPKEAAAAGGKVERRRSWRTHYQRRRRQSDDTTDASDISSAMTPPIKSKILSRTGSDAQEGGRSGGAQANEYIFT